MSKNNLNYLYNNINTKYYGKISDLCSLRHLFLQLTTDLSQFFINTIKYSFKKYFILHINLNLSL